MGKSTITDPRTVRQRARMMALMEAGPMSAEQIARHIHLTRSAVLLHVRAMRDEGILRIAGYVTQVRSREIPLYGIGSEPDEPYVLSRHRPENKVFEVQRAKVKGAILAQLAIARATAPELAMLTGLSNPTIRKYLPKMKREGLIHRAAWVAKESGGLDMAVWAAGDREDAAKGRTIKRSSALAYLPEEQRDIILRKREVNSIIKNARKTPQGPFAALGV